MLQSIVSGAKDMYGLFVIHIRVTGQGPYAISHATLQSGDDIFPSLTIPLMTICSKSFSSAVGTTNNCLCCHTILSSSVNT